MRSFGLLLLNTGKIIESGLFKKEFALFDTKIQKHTLFSKPGGYKHAHVEKYRQRFTSRRCSALPHDADRLWPLLLLLLLLPLLLWDLSDHESGVLGEREQQ